MNQSRSPAGPVTVAVLLLFATLYFGSYLALVTTTPSDRDVYERISYRYHDLVQTFYLPVQPLEPYLRPERVYTAKHWLHLIERPPRRFVRTTEKRAFEVHVISLTNE